MIADDPETMIPDRGAAGTVSIPADLGKRTRTKRAQHTPEPTPTPAEKRGAVGQWGAEDVQLVGGLYAMVCVFFSFQLASTLEDQNLGMQSQEAQSICEPLARITLRHLKVAAGKRGDVADAIAASCGLFAYLIRVYSMWDDRRRVQRQQARSQQPHVQASDAGPNGTVTVLRRNGQLEEVEAPIVGTWDVDAARRKMESGE